MRTVCVSEEEIKEIDEYLARFKNCPAEKILRYLGDARAFFYEHMTPEGKRFFERSRREERGLEERVYQRNSRVFIVP